MTTKTQFLLLSFWLLPAFGFSQNATFENTDEVKKYCELVVGSFEKADAINAFALLREIWVLPQSEIEVLEMQTAKQLSMLSDRFGKAIDRRFVREEFVEGVAYRATYVVRFEIHLIRLVFTFYQGPKNGWMLNSFKWDDNITNLFDE